MDGSAEFKHLKKLKLDPFSWSQFGDDLIFEICFEDNDQSRRIADLQSYLSQFPEWDLVDERDTEDEQLPPRTEPAPFMMVEQVRDTEEDEGGEEENSRQDANDEFIDNLLSDYLTHDIFGFQNAPIFPEICVLSFSEMFLSAAMASLFNFETLTSLTLRTCRNWPKFLEHVMRCNARINLSTLEIQFGFQISGHDTVLQSETLLRFLQAFKGLEELYIGRVQAIDTAQFFRQRPH
ncbi:hypothetical protein FOXYSP1_19462 [Fusarium oxysporum f. sp. phaseoli]